MEDTISKLVEADKKASEIVSEAQEHFNNIMASMPDEKNRFKEEYKNRAIVRISEVRENEQDNFHKTVSFMKMTVQERIRYLEKIYFERHIQLEDELYKRVLDQ